MQKTKSYYIGNGLYLGFMLWVLLVFVTVPMYPYLEEIFGDKFSEALFFKANLTLFLAALLVGWIIGLRDAEKYGS